MNMKIFHKEKTIEILDSECWYGGVVRHGVDMPITKDSEYFYEPGETIEGDSYSGFFVSNEGRFFSVAGDCRIRVKDGAFKVEYDAELRLESGYADLKGAYYAATKYFGKNALRVPRELLVYPQFCTWTEMGVDVSEEKILSYAQSIVDEKFPHGVLLIDDGWMAEYGDWSFDDRKFRHPKEMIQKLKTLGFKVMLWLVPFVSDKADSYKTLERENGLIRTAEGKVLKRKWWNGEAAILDLTNPFVFRWLKDKLDALMSEYGVDGFKFDGGGARFYRDDYATYSSADSIGQSQAWSELAMLYTYGEMKECVGYSGRHAIVRLNDKRRNWDRTEGLGALVPDMIQAGLCGYLYTCADMIGGGQISDFGADKVFNDDEVIKRYCECSALMPCMQYSHGYWKKDRSIAEEFVRFAELHVEFKEYLESLIDEAEEKNTPIVRSLEFEFPHQGFEKEIDAFMLGSSYLVAPVIVKNATKKKVLLPKGYRWQYVPTGDIYESGAQVEVDAPIGVLPYFKKLEA